MSMLSRIYTGFKSLPLIGRLIEKIRSRVYGYIVRIIDERQLALVERDNQLSERDNQLSERDNQLSERDNQLSERIEFVRLELFYELMHKVKNSTLSTDKMVDLKPKVLNQQRYNQAVAQQQIRLNLGCGHKPIKGYLNVDQRELPQVDIQASILNLPFETGVVDEISASHLIEHFTVQVLRNELLPYWRDLLKPMGKLHLIAPNAQAMIEAYAQQKMPFEQLTTVLLGMQEYDGDFHFAMLSPDNLTKLLQEAGFGDIHIVVPDRENGLCLEMEITARKPLPN